MVGSEVQLCKHVQVVVNLRTLSQCEAHALEYVDDLILHDCKRMACAEAYRVSRACQVDVVSRFLSLCVLLFQIVDLLQSCLLQLVDLHTYNLLLIRRYVAEVSHESCNLALFAQVFKSQLFNLFSIRCCKIVHFLKKLFYLF